MTETEATIDLVDLFEEAARAVAEHKQEINELDGYNGNHGDNMVANVNAIASTLRAHQQERPTEALKSASRKMAEGGAGGTSQYYAKGLQTAAERLSDKERLSAADGMTLIQTLLGALPREGYPQPQEASPTVLDMLTAFSGSWQPAQQAPPAPQASQAGGLLDALMGLSGAQAAPAAQQPAPQQTADPLAGLLGMLTGAETQPPTPPQTTEPADDAGLDLGDVIETLLPAGLAYLQARQSGADGAQAGQAALMQALLGGQRPQPSTSRDAAGMVIAQSMLRALLKRRA